MAAAVEDAVDPVAGYAGFMPFPVPVTSWCGAIRRGIGLIRQNYAMSIAVNAAGLLVSAAGALSPVVASILHNASSVAVVANSSRLIRYQLPGQP